MFVLKIKADATDIDVPAVRSLLGFAIIVIFLYRNENSYAINIAVAVILVAALLFVQTLLVKFRINTLLLMTIAALLVFAATHAFIFSISLVVFALVVRLSYIQPVIEITEKGIRVKKTFQSAAHEWGSFNNIILKDNLLSLDFKNNKLLQLELDDSVKTNEQQVNDFCAQKIIL